MIQSFYATFYRSGHLKLDDLKEAVQGGVLTKEDYKDIAGKAYRSPSRK